MQPRTCHQCHLEILDDGIEHRRRQFCSDECCELFEDLFMLRGEPDPQDLAEAEEDLDGADLDADDLDDEDLDADDLDDQDRDDGLDVEILELDL